MPSFTLVCNHFNILIQPIVRQQKHGLVLQQKRLFICHTLIQCTAEDRRTRNIFFGTEEDTWRESQLGAIKIVRNSGAPTFRCMQGHQGKYMKYVNIDLEPRTNFKEEWKIFLLVQ